MGGRSGSAPSKRPAKPKDKKQGRPPALTDAVQKEIIDAVELLGMAESRACMAAGFSYSIAGKWKTRGREALEKWDKLTPEQQTEESKYVGFFKALRDASYKFERANLIIIQNAAVGGDWRAAKARLECNPSTRVHYAKRQYLSGDPDNKTPIPIASIPTTDMSAEEIKERAQRVLNAHKASQAKKPQG